MSEKRATIKDVASLAGFSTAVVSYVLNDSKEKTIPQVTKDKVWEAARKLGYVPNSIARNMRAQASMSIGVVPYWSMETTVFAQMLQGILDSCDAARYSTLLCKPRAGENAFSYLDDVYRKRVDGLIFICPPENSMILNEKEHADKMREAGVPFVMINSHTDLKETACVDIDYVGSTRLVTEYLISLGHKKITYIAPLQSAEMECRLRLEGYRQAMQKHNLPEDAADCSALPEKISACTAIVTNKSETARLALQEAIRQGIAVPDQLSVAAGNTEAYSEMLFPPLTTAKIPSWEIGKQAVEMVLKQIRGKAEGFPRILPCELKIRSSTAEYQEGAK